LVVFVCLLSFPSFPSILYFSVIIMHCCLILLFPMPSLLLSCVPTFFLSHPHSLHYLISKIYTFNIAKLLVYSLRTQVPFLYKLTREVVGVSNFLQHLYIWLIIESFTLLLQLALLIWVEGKK
jgi:hypothetical protein